MVECKHHDGRPAATRCSLSFADEIVDATTAIMPAEALKPDVLIAVK